jgi:hypothetical protein
MFTSVLHPLTGDEIQIKSGWDDCEWYKLGDTVDWRIRPDRPLEGKLLDGAYEGESTYWDYEQKKIVWTGHCWVVIKNHVIVAVEAMEMSPPELRDRDGMFRGGFYAQQAFIEKKHGVRPPSLDLWSMEAWAAYARREEMHRRQLWEWNAEDYGLSLEEKAQKAFYRFFVRAFKEDCVIRRLLPPMPVTNEEASQIVSAEAGPQ